MINIRDERGAALVLALALLTILPILAVAMVFVGTYETAFLIRQRLSDAAFYIADGGVQYALNQLQQSSSYTGPTTYSVGNVGQFIVSVSTQGQPSGYYVIISTGYVPNSTSFQAKRIVNSVVELTQQISPVFQNAIASQGNLTIQGSVVTNSSNPTGEGNIYTGGNLVAQGSPTITINGAASAVGTITTQGNVTITGGEDPGVAPLTFPPVNTAPYISQAQAGGTYNGNYTIQGSGNPSLGPLYINGNLVIQGSAQLTLTGTVFVTGSVTLQGTSSITGSQALVANGNVTMQGNDSGQIPLVISVNGNVTLQGSNAIQGALIYAPNGSVTIQGNPNINGVVVGKTVTAQGNPTIIRQVNLAGYSLPGGGGNTITHVSWQEL
jgi:hypothetical protein